MVGDKNFALELHSLRSKREFLSYLCISEERSTFYEKGEAGRRGLKPQSTSDDHCNSRKKTTTGDSPGNFKQRSSPWLTKLRRATGSQRDNVRTQKKAPGSKDPTVLHGVAVGH